MTRWRRRIPTASSRERAAISDDRALPRWPALLGAALTLAMAVGLGRELFGAGLAGLGAAVPADPLYYLAFAGLYLAAPLGDYAIFRHLWRAPRGAFGALLRKRIANDVVLGYSGEAYFYAWARTHGPPRPFGAVKDVSILSAIAGNAVTLAIVAAALPFADGVMTPAQTQALAISVALIALISLPWLIFSRRVFSLPRAALRWVFAAHVVRLLAGAVLIAAAWEAAMPGVAAGTWLLLSAARLLVTRLPFVPNKDMLFANAAILLIGSNAALAATLAFTAALTLVVHVALLAGFGVVSLTGRAHVMTPSPTAPKGTP